MKGGLTLICMALIAGIIGGIEHGTSMWNALWCIPLFAVIGWCALMAHIENERDLRRYEAWKVRKMRNEHRR